jgi:23S rRNA U2552 (ribose-2'-O)-methylase RlmE/FtsJ
MELYQDIIYNKFILSNKYYNIVLKDEQYYTYLYYYDIMNVYALFPTIIDIDLSIIHTHENLNDLTNRLNNKDKYEFNDQNINLDFKLLEEKINILKFTEKELKTRIRGQVRKLFSYEIIDELKNNYNAEYVTTAWMKSYEIIEKYKLLTNSGDDINYFGICEQPGAFIYSINHWCKTHSKKFNFTVQSLIDQNNPKIFKPEQKLFSKYKDNYDYGYDKTGDVTNLTNIKYYRKKYYDKHFDIITADCGLDCSDDFMKQEINLSKVIIAQVILAISLADTNSNYFFKLFTVYQKQTKQIIYLLTNLFEQVYLCRTLTTKPESGEIYCICKKFKYTKKETDYLMDELYRWYDDQKNNLINIPDDFYNKINDFNRITYYRRITSINFLYFRFKNNNYAQEKREIYDYVNKLVKHYQEYFIKLYNINKLSDQDKLII